jgi:hypothetical protein
MDLLLRPRQCELAPVGACPRPSLIVREGGRDVDDVTVIPFPAMTERVLHGSLPGKLHKPASNPESGRRMSMTRPSGARRITVTTS